MDLPELEQLAIDLVREAGELVRARGRDHLHAEYTKSSDVDVVTATDLASEALLRRRLADARPEDAFLGEESPAAAGSSGLTWVVDPVDGTVNYLYGIPAYAISVAVVSGPADPAQWTQQAGAVLDVTRNVVWSAHRGGGARRHLPDGTVQTLQVRTADSLAHALVATGFGYAAERRAGQARVLTHVLGQVRDIRRIGAAALDLCRVADGTVDAFYERGLKPWDQAAGGLIAAEAGAAVSDLAGGPGTENMLVAGAPTIHDALVALLREAGADREP